MEAFSKNPNRSTAEQIAEVVWEATTDGKAQVHYLAGKDAKMLVRLRKWLGFFGFIKEVRKRFFG